MLQFIPVVLDVGLRSELSADQWSSSAPYWENISSLSWFRAQRLCHVKLSEHQTRTTKSCLWVKHWNVIVHAVLRRTSKASKHVDLHVVLLIIHSYVKLEMTFLNQQQSNSTGKQPVFTSEERMVAVRLTYDDQNSESPANRHSTCEVSLSEFFLQHICWLTLQCLTGSIDEEGQGRPPHLSVHHPPQLRFIAQLNSVQMQAAVLCLLVGEVRWLQPVCSRKLSALWRLSRSEASVSMLLF